MQEKLKKNVGWVRRVFCGVIHQIKNCKCFYWVDYGKKRLIHPTFFLFLYFFITLNSFASCCNDVTRRLYDIWLNHNEDVLDLCTVQEVLGPGYIRHVIQQTYTWDDFSITVRDGRTVSIAGPKPPLLCAIPLPSLAETISILGKPVMTTTRRLTWISWYCCDSPSSLSYLVDTQKNIVEYEGRYCWSNDFSNCARFTGN